ncbi:hypothetical protein [Halobellus sp. GM3]|uniref:hypothetical protein n=1 Tax=Halobellus sp. GM3 TaxID=3458410 RepID=UPI00403DEA32
MSVKLTPHVTWISNCVEVGDHHMHLSNYLVSTSTDSILIGAGMEDFSQHLLDTVTAETDGAGVDTVLLAHSMLPHTENVKSIESKWPDATVYAASGFPRVIGIPGSEPWKRTETIEIGDRAISFLNPIITDIVLSQWIFDHESGILFTAEAFGHYHRKGVCGRTASEVGGISGQMVFDFYREKFPHLSYVDADKLEETIRSFFDRMPVKMLAPIHGNPVEGAKLSDYIDVSVDAISRITGDAFYTDLESIR